MQSMPNFTESQKQEVVRFQKMQQSLQMINQNKSAIESRLKETELAVKELDAVDEDAIVYQSVGGLMIKKDRNYLLEITKEKQEQLEIRAKSLTEQQNRMRSQIEPLRKKIEELFKSKGLS
jgi:prefoldin beta subunit